MQFPRIRTASGGLLFLVASVAPLSGQQQQQLPPMPDSIRELVVEFQTLQSRVDSVQTEALQTHPGLQTAQQELQLSVTQVMIERDPALEAKIDSIPTLQEAFAQAQQAGDTTQLQTIAQTGQRIQARIQEARAEALETAEVQEELATFEESMMAAMEEIEPDVDEMLDRMEAISVKLQEYQAGQAGG